MSQEHTSLGLSPGRSLRRSSSRVTGIDCWLARLFLRFAGNPAITAVLWDGSRLATSDQASRADLYIHNRRALIRMLLNPEPAFGEAYRSGGVEVSVELVNFLKIIYVVKPDETWLEKLSRYLKRGPRVNTLRGSRDNIHRHYDIGNDFYALWLDPAMQYTCAYYPDSAMGLEAAQQAKMEHVCRKLQLKAGDTVVEAGCGWGGLARYMAQHHGVQVRSYNISQQQVDYARQKVGEMGLDNQVEYVEDDYRNITEKFDVFVSVGMLEHVGRSHYRELGNVVNRCLKQEGRGLIHTIGRNKPRCMNAWIERRIFPGAYPPALWEMAEIFEPNNFSVLDVENLRLHYARTLGHWLERFERSREFMHEKFDDAFIRTWRLYLSGSLCAFLLGELQLFQVVFARGSNNTIPWNREHMYPTPGSREAA